MGVFVVPKGGQSLDQGYLFRWFEHGLIGMGRIAGHGGKAPPSQLYSIG